MVNITPCWIIPSNFVSRECSWGLPQEKDCKKPKTIREFGDISFLIGKKCAIRYHIGTYGMGGPGFIGIRFKKEHKGVSQLVLTLWHAASWITRDGVNFDSLIKKNWDNRRGFEKENSGKLKYFTVQDKSCSFKIGKHKFVLDKDPKKRPTLNISQKLKKLKKNDSLFDAWVVCPDIMNLMV